jgi:predicted nucleic acid-binding protein
LKPIFIDTGFLIALLNANDAYHQTANQLSLKYEGITFLTTDAVLLELGNALSRSGKQQASDMIRYFQQAEEASIMHLTPELFAKGLQLYDKYQDKSWGLVDCISFIVMQELELTEVLTFDQHFAQAGFMVLKD